MSAEKQETAPAEAAVSLPQHVAFIMDGNGRWARQRGLPRVAGHRRGAETVRMVIEESRRLGIRYLTLFSFSTENWQRPAKEVSALMSLFERALRTEKDAMLKNDIRLRLIGDRLRLPAAVQQAAAELEELSRPCRGMDVILAVSYGGREEIVQAARQIAAAAAAGTLQPEEVDAAVFRRCLYAPEVPDPDLLIRSSAEMRLSNFLLWQLAYAEIVVSPLLWPDFDRAEYQRCLAQYAGRERRFGGVSD